MKTTKYLIILCLLCATLGTPAVASPNEDLFTAARSGTVEGVKSALANGAEVNNSKSDHDGATPLMRASEARYAGGDYANVIEVLLAKGANVNAQDITGATALIYATISRNPPIVRLLLKKGADVNVRGGGSTALIFALDHRGGDSDLFSKQAEIAKLLLDAGADVNATDDFGKTALMQAAGNNQVDAVRLLLDKGANIYAKDDNQKTALDYATSSHSEPVRAILEERARRLD